MKPSSRSWFRMWDRTLLNLNQTLFCTSAADRVYCDIRKQSVENIPEILINGFESICTKCKFALYDLSRSSQPISRLRRHMKLVSEVWCGLQGRGGGGALVGSGVTCWLIALCFRWCWTGAEATCWTSSCSVQVLCSVFRLQLWNELQQRRSPLVTWCRLRLETRHDDDQRDFVFPVWTTDDSAVYKTSRRADSRQRGRSVWKWVWGSCDSKKSSADPIRRFCLSSGRKALISLLSPCCLFSSSVEMNKVSMNSNIFFFNHSVRPTHCLTSANRKK